MGEVKGTRRYSSRLRADNARRTRQAVVTVATELFVTKGYAATSLADVAAGAGVARPTVFSAFGSKAALLRQVLDQALAGDDEPVPVAQRPWFRPVWDATDPGAALDAYARVCTLIGERAAAVFEAVRRGADADPEVADLWRNTQRNRRAGATMVIEHAAALGPLRDPGRAVDLLWFLNDPAHYAALVTTCGWPEDDFTGWLARQMRDSLLPR